LQPHIADEDPRGLLQALATRYAQTLERPLAVHVGPCEHAPALFYFDRHLVRMALESALHNACRYARSAVWLDARADGKGLVFSIEDDGPGPASTGPEDTSTRLGTELCVAVARAHGVGPQAGRVSLGQREEGGARFEMWLY
jgi:signal transduction histidine kinase